MPLVRAHAEYVKLVRSLHDGRVFDTPPQPLFSAVVPKQSIWRSNQKCRTIPTGRILRIEVYARSLVHWSCDKWNHSFDSGTRDTGFGVHFSDLAAERLPAGLRILFTLYNQEKNQWEGRDYEVTIV
jgi:glucoamylase